MEKKINITYSIVSFEELPTPIQSLIIDSELAVNTSHAPYSNFHVGAALLLENGTIIKGSNQENVSYPIGFCAERTVLSAKVSIAPYEKVAAIAISVLSGTGKILPPIPPCGMCRQVLLEQEQKQKCPIKVYLSGNNKEIIVIDTIEDLLPFQFDGSVFE
jgi:cytidine deaminase